MVSRLMTNEATILKAIVIVILYPTNGLGIGTPTLLVEEVVGIIALPEGITTRPNKVEIVAEFTDTGLDRMV